jgi:hypothetical protein
MSDPMTIQNYDNAGIQIGNNEFEDGILKFPGADTYAEGTVLGKQEVEEAIADTPDAGNTGDGTLVATVAAGDIIPAIGNWNLECTFAITNGGVFKLEDPSGNIIADNLTLRVGDGLVTTFVEGGIKIVVTEGTTDFAAGDKFALAVVADGDWVIYAVDGVGGAQFAKGVLTIETTATGAADKAFRPLISGKVRREKLLIDASAAAITDLVADQLRDYGILAVSVDELNIQDNQ